MSSHQKSVYSMRDFDILSQHRDVRLQWTNEHSTSCIQIRRFMGKGRGSPLKVFLKHCLHFFLVNMFLMHLNVFFFPKNHGRKECEKKRCFFSRWIKKAQTTMYLNHKGKNFFHGKTKTGRCNGENAVLKSVVFLLVFFKLRMGNNVEGAWKWS